MSDLDAFRATYFEECAELLAELEEEFRAIESGDRSVDRLNAVFRAVHSIKGGGGAFGFAELVAFAHAYETLLDQVRDGRVELTAMVVGLCIQSNDIIADLVAAARTGEVLAEGFGAAARSKFDAITGGSAGAAEDGDAADEFDLDFTPVGVVLAHRMGDGAAPVSPLPASGREGRFEIRFRPHGELYSSANDPQLLFRELASFGEMEVHPLFDDIPALAEFEPFGVYCGWEITLIAPEPVRQQLTEVFEFVEGICDLTILWRAGVREATGDPGEPEAQEEALSLTALADQLKAEQQRVPPAPAPLAPLSTESQSDADGHHPGGSDDRRNGVQSIRVDLDKIDRVVNMVGELVINQSMLTQQLDETLRVRYQELVRGLEVLAQTTRGLQDSVMSIRAQPVKTVLSRMPRLVRELAARTGKKIRLDTAGENTEIDKTVIEQLADPLTHMIRNSADHGIEPPQERLSAGKPETGVIRIAAEQAGSNILITVEDDGRGIDRQRVLEVARKRMVVAADALLSEDQIDQLIFAPGFSTAEAVSDLSGRGVGMDVVLSNIKKMGGSVLVRSWPGRGTRMTLRLPLTLAVLDVMLVKVAGAPYVIPLSSIIETIQCGRASFARLPTGTKVLQLRGEYVQVADLAQCFGLATDAEHDTRFVILCEAEGGAKVAVIVDDIIGQQQVVIKSLEENFESVEGVAGGTILGDGNVALIVDVQGLRPNTGRRTAA